MDPASDETCPLLRKRYNNEPEEAGRERQSNTSLWRGLMIMVALSTMALVSSMVTGLLTVAMPRMAIDLHIKENMLLWPGSLYGLSTGCFLLTGGSLADVLGSRFIFLTGCCTISVFALGTGLCTTPTQVMVCLAGQGTGVAMGLPTTMGLLHSYISQPRRRNMGLAVIGASQPIGYAFGLFGGGIVVDALSWRCSWFLEFAIALLAVTLAICVLPPLSDQDLNVTGSDKEADISHRLLSSVDWTGAFLAATALGSVSYVLLNVSGRTSQESNDGGILNCTEIALLCLSGAGLAGFIFWEARREKKGQSALIPTHFWKSRAFSVVGAMLFLAYAISHILESLLSLYFQKVQHLSATEACVRFAPNALTGVAMNMISGLVAHRVETYWIALIGSCLTVLSPLLMVSVTVDQPYMFSTFGALLTSSSSCDILFLVSATIIARAFSAELHARASAVLNTLAQFGTAIGMAAAAVVSSTVSRAYDEQEHQNDRGPPSHEAPKTSSAEALLAGYRADFWLCFGMAVCAVVLSAWGLRNGKEAKTVKRGAESEKGAAEAAIPVSASSFGQLPESLV